MPYAREDLLVQSSTAHAPTSFSSKKPFLLYVPSYKLREKRKIINNIKFNKNKGQLLILRDSKVKDS